MRRIPASQESLHYHAEVSTKDATNPASSPEPKPVRDCPADRDCKGQYEHANPVFKGMDYFFMAIGISSRPVPIERKCALCGHVWEVATSRQPW